MNSVAEMLRPLARREELVIETLPDEVLVYDLKRNKAHCLSLTAAAVWGYCNGEATVPELTQLVAQKVALPVEEAVIWLALEQLGKAHLLNERVARPLNMQVSRRELMRTAGAVAAAALVTSIAAPTAAQASTCLAPGSACTSGLSCCSGTCTNNTSCA